MSYFNTNKPHSYVMQSTKLYKKAAGHLNWEGGVGGKAHPGETQIFLSKLCKSSCISAWNLAFPAFTSPTGCGIFVKIFIMNRYISKTFTTSKNTIDRQHTVRTVWGQL